MDERIVVCLALQGPHPVDYAQRLDSLVQRASAFGATLCACGWEGLAFAFRPDEVDEAVEFSRAPDADSLTGPFGVGIARGGWQPLMSPNSSVELGWGDALLRARAVAGLANAGEVLLDEELQDALQYPAAETAPRSTLDTPIVRAVLLAAQRGWADDTQRAAVTLGQAVLTGREMALDVVSGEPGALATLRAAPGMGGSRLLLECAIAASPAATLVLRPAGAAVEPLSSLRFALAREIALFRSRPVSDASAATLAALVDGKGATVEAAATLLEDWLAGVSPGLLLVDDANDVDPSTLEVVANSVLAAQRPFRAVARLDSESPLPAVLALLPPGPEITIGPLAPADAQTVAASWLACVIDDDLLRKYVAAADGSPLVLRERLIDALASGNIVRADGRARMHPDFDDATYDGSLRASIAERLAHLSAGGKAVVLAVAILGGDVSDELAAALVESAADVPVEFVDEVGALVESGWLEELEPGWLALPSRSHRTVVLASLLEDRRASWHRAASLTLETHGLGLTYAEAAWHAAMAGDDRRASRLATEAATIADEAKLEGAAKALSVLAASPVRWTPEADSSPAIGAGRGRMLTVPPTPDQALAARLVAHGRMAGSGDSYLPLDIPEPTTPAGVPRPHPPTIPRAPRPASATAPGARGKLPAPSRPAVQHAAREVPAPEPAPPKLELPRPTIPMPSTEPDRPVVAAPDNNVRDSFTSLPTVHIDEMAGTLPLLAREALQSGNEEALELWFTELTSAGKSPRLIERLRAIATLRGRDAGKAIATLREACVQARSLGNVERSRSHLALAVALARVGRLTDSLIEGLEALSRAREQADAHAEHACLRFLQQLYEAAGQDGNAFRDARPG